MRKLFALAFAATCILCGVVASALPMWSTGTATATAHDKQLAHDLAFDEAQRNAEAEPGCAAPYGEISEIKISYDRLEATDEWRATVTVREMCTYMPERD